MGLHKLMAGSGYDYLTRQVAVQDSTEKGSTSLASYYAQRGESPGVWVGSGMAGLEGLNVGDQVTAEQMQALFGKGLHPLARERMVALEGSGASAADYRAVSRLGLPFKVYSPDVSPFRLEVAKRLAALKPADDVSAGVRAGIRTEVGREFFRTEFGREPADPRELSGLIAKLSRPRTSAVAGFDLTFSPVKSVSSLWALADPETAGVIERCHRQAIADALTFIERGALFTRTGAKGVRQVEVRGLVAAAFTHRDSRAGDPDLHTHVAVANKVQTLEGRWLSIDGRVLFKAKVAASETYNTALEAHLVDALGLRFVDRPTGAGRRPVREIQGVEPVLMVRWSARRRSIEQRRDELAGEFLVAHGRPPTVVETLALSQQATLETRQAKHEPRSLAEQRTAWRAQAEAVLGGPGGVARMIDTALHPARATGPVLDEAWFVTTSADIVATVEGSRATWQSWHIRAEALRRVRAAAIPAGQVEATVDRLVATALTDFSVRLSAPAYGIVEPPVLRRTDGQSVYTVAGADLYSSPRVLAAEQRLVGAAGRRDGRTVDPATVDLALLETAANGVELNAGQVGLVRGMASSGVRVQVGIAPAGSGKTTAMQALTRAWTDAGGTVVGLAPSAAAAGVLGDQINAHTDTLAKLAWSIGHQDLPDWAATIGPDSLVVVDEAGMADTLTLDTVVGFVVGRGGSVRLVGDDQQLAAVGAGGVVRDIAARHGALRLNELVRFTDPAEGGASLALREGRPEALGFYLDHHWVHVGDLTTLTDQVFSAWQTDRTHGLDAIMLAPTRDLVAELNQRARTHRLAGTVPGREVELADGLAASVGDVIITRTNDRRLRTSPTDWVKNGDRWSITATTRDGAVRARHLRSGLSVELPAGYVAGSVELGYASTVHAAQGISADSMHGLATGVESRQQLYTMLTRGRHTNHIYLQTVGDGDPHSLIRPEAVRPPTATDLLEQILARDDTPTSATTLQARLGDPRVRLGEAVARYTDAISIAAEDLAGDLAVRALERQVEQLLPGVPWCDAYPALRSQLLIIQADDRDPITELDRAAREQPLTGAADPAAVLDWRLDTTLTQREQGPLPWLPAIPSRLRDHPVWGPYLDARARLVTDLADTVHRQALDADRVPGWLASSPGEVTGQTVADLTVWRAAMGVPDADMRPTGERQSHAAAGRWQRRLDQRLTDGHQPALAEWGPLLYRLESRLDTDEFTATLATRLSHLSASGVDACGLLRTAVAVGDLPDDHPAAALWWRIAGHLTPAVATAVEGDQPLTSAWSTTLADMVGAERALELQQSRWWPALVTAVDHGIRQGWSPTDLLNATPTGVGPVDDCLALVWRISTLTDPPQTLDDRLKIPHPADQPPADLWDGTEPATPTVVGSLADLAQIAVLDPASVGPIDADGDLEGGDRLVLQAMIRDTLTTPEPTDLDIRAMLARADTWRDCPTTPERLAEINRLTADFYQDRYADSWAQPYLTHRLRTDITGHPWLQPGYAPDGWTALVTHLHQLGVTDQEMLTAGVATCAKTGRLIDRFRDRVVFPIRTVEGLILGFVGRRHPDHTDDHTSGPKYLNTGETPLFHKGDQLYTTAPLTPDVVPVIVEGPMDAIAVTLATEGRYLGVAPLGTALTDQQATQLTLHGHSAPIVATDADLAGRIAAQRDFWILTALGHDPSYAALPDGADPADLLATGHADILTTALDRAQPLARVLVDERLDHLPAAQSSLEALRVVAAQPSRQWETGVQDIAGRIGLPAGLLRPVLADLVTAWNRDPRAAGHSALGDIKHVAVRLARHDATGYEGEHVRPPRVPPEERAVIQSRLPRRGLGRGR